MSTHEINGIGRIHPRAVRRSATASARPGARRSTSASRRCFDAGRDQRRSRSLAEAFNMFNWVNYTALRHDEVLDVGSTFDVDDDLVTINLTPRRSHLDARTADVPGADLGRATRSTAARRADRAPLHLVISGGSMQIGRSRFRPVRDRDGPIVFTLRAARRPLTCPVPDGALTTVPASGVHGL